jgi:hypothetical protein
MFSQVDYKIPHEQPMYTYTSSIEPEKFSVEEVLNAYTNVNGMADVNQSEIDNVTHYLLKAADEYSTYIRLKEKFEGAPVEPAPEDKREPTGYYYSGGASILFNDKIEYELPRKFLLAPYSSPPTRMRGEVIKVFEDCGVAYDFHVTDAEEDGSRISDTPTLASIVDSGVKIKKVN